MKQLITAGIFALLLAFSAPAQAQTAQAQTLTKCEGTDATQLRACQQQNLKTARKALDRKIIVACRKQAKGPDLIGCRADMMMKAADGIQ